MLKQLSPTTTVLSLIYHNTVLSTPMVEYPVTIGGNNRCLGIQGQIH